MRPFLILCFSLLLAACGGDAPANINLGAAAPAFATQRADGSKVDFPADFAGRPVVVRFWADWCRYCEGEMKAIEQVVRRHPEVVVLAVNAGQDKKTVDAFMTRIGVSYPALLDGESAIAKRYGVVGLPTTFFVDGAGVVRGKIVGEADEASFEREAVALLR